jgi:hypothetical protein
MRLSGAVAATSKLPGRNPGSNMLRQPSYQRSILEKSSLCLSDAKIYYDLFWCPIRAESAYPKKLRQQETENAVPNTIGDVDLSVFGVECQPHGVEKPAEWAFDFG